MPLTEVKLPTPVELRGGWAALAAIQAAYGWDDVVYATDKEWYYSDMGGNWASLRFTDDGKAVLIGHDHEYSETKLTEDDTDSILLKDTPAWWSEMALPIIYGEVIGFVYGWDGDKWQRATYEADDGFQYMGLLDATRSKGNHSLSETVEHMFGCTDYHSIADLISADANITENILSKIISKKLPEAIEAARKFLKAPLYYDDPGSALVVEYQGSSKNIVVDSDATQKDSSVEIDNKDLDINHRGVTGESHLHREARRGHIENVEKLLVMGADINARDSQGKTPISVAASDGQAEVTKLLADSGADLHLGLTTMASHKPDGRTPVMLAVSSGKTKCVEILINAGCSPDTRFVGGDTLLMNAVNKNKYTVAKRLIALGADVNAQQRACGYSNAAGYTPLIYAVSKSTPKIVELLLNEGADPNYQLQSDPPMYVHEFNTGKNANKIDELLLSAGATIK